MIPMISIAVCQEPMLETRWGKGRWWMKHSLKASLLLYHTFIFFHS